MFFLGDGGARRRTAQKMRWEHRGRRPFHGAFPKDWETEKFLSPSTVLPVFWHYFIAGEAEGQRERRIFCGMRGSVRTGSKPHVPECFETSGLRRSLGCGCVLGDTYVRP